MLKIKDNIDLDELEKLGYKEREDKWMGLCYYKSFSNPKYEDEEYAGISIVNCRETRSIGFDLEILIGNLDKMTLNYYIGKYEDELYELTSRNMVEKVVKDGQK